MIVCRTVKGKGSKVFEGKVEFHGTTPSKEELEIAVKELSKRRCVNNSAELRNAKCGVKGSRARFNDQFRIPNSAFRT